MRQFVREEIELLDQNIIALIKQFELVKIHREWLENYLLRNGMKDVLSQMRIKTTRIDEMMKTL